MNQLEARQILFAQGNIASWYLYDHQQPLYSLIRDTTREIIVPNISRRFGKSTTCVAYSLEQAIQTKQDIRYATAFQTDLLNFIIPIFNDILQWCPEAYRPTWKESKKTFYFPNGSTIRLIGLDKNTNAIRGNAIDILVIDEAAFVQNLEYIYKSIIVPATAARKFKIIFPSTPPVSPLHFWASELIPKAKARNTYLEFTIEDNSSLADEEKARLINEVGGINSSTAQREFFCKIVIDETRAIAPSFKESNLGSTASTDIKWDYVGDSGGLRDKTVILQVGYDHDLKKTIIKSELTFDPKTPTPVIAERFQEWSGTDALTLDAHGQTQVDLADLNLKVANPLKADFQAGLQLINASFHNDEILIDPSCELLILSLKTGLLNKQRTDYERSQKLGHCDAVAALIYALRAVDRQTDLRPKLPKSRYFQLPDPKSGLGKALGL